MQALLGHHDKWWGPKQWIMAPRPQQQVEMARGWKDKGSNQWNCSNRMDLASSDPGQLANSDRMPPAGMGAEEGGALCAG